MLIALICLLVYVIIIVGIVVGLGAADGGMGEDVMKHVLEALANVVRHAEAASVDVTLTVAGGQIGVTVADDGRGLPAGWSPETLRRDGHVGLAGMRERVAALGGAVTLSARPAGGVALAARLPVADRGAA